ncbi:lysoplasmalogenase-like protein TMEM86A isoform X2 [Anopheles merus]|uniref:lysoplasmalogenase-like protein TMEM86A isoform X1 n=1 Tax=Anopheles merus TaxID=30066 RepID=UPI001BE454E5|nr:lysoplasmalogenase-like protein TMEM86A isoform X1 [Anopheles merus]XP_041783769.1 lysoplasmalogenase-like protein TMEM86A isoform X1 [Anopheles merus]XP_041783770.1 lysoplasmalogenase-like protein TMEM86A isoform X1 [Anopheles merus]XP_041783771.1 lysoplasmalogenase-like protein TMEM86A isoform X1 [Anopheles merus]XP_041783772.1 lysoplasmalogenase-like protein TMEM86A isoform X2 [Anopheles merus]
MTQNAIDRKDKSTISMLIPFITSVIMYFSLIQHTERSSTSSTVLKCMPIFSLLFYVMLKDSKASRKANYHSRIFYGLVFSVLGDFLLNYELFEPGMGAFGVAQIFYIWAFGMKLNKIWIGTILYLTGFLAITLFFENLNTVIKICLPFYAILLLTMCWRSLARIDRSDSYLRIVCGIASILFVISDGIIAIDKFFTPIKSAQTYIMITYYLAQVGITLSINDVQLYQTSTFTESSVRSDNKTKHKSY